VTEDRKILRRLEEEVRKAGVSNVAACTGMPRTHFYRMFHPDYGNPSLKSVIEIARAVGMRLVLEDGGET
jgi:DNA-binding phage protein